MCVSLRARAWGQEEGRGGLCVPVCMCVHIVFIHVFVHMCLCAFVCTCLCVHVCMCPETTEEILRSKEEL